MNKRRPIKIVVLSERFLLSEGLKSFITTNSDFLYVAHIAEPERLEERLKGYDPDMMILDWEMPVLKDTEHIVKLKKGLPSTSFIMVSDHYDVMTIKQLSSHNINSFLYSGCNREELENAVYATYAGNRFICGKVLDVILDEKEKFRACDAVDLSIREVEIINLIAQGLASKEIKEALKLSIHTINTHKRNIYRKLKFNKSSDLILFALKHNMGDYASILN